VQVARIGADALEGRGTANDSFGSVRPAYTMDTDPDKAPEAGGKGIREKMAE
jgi:hypothetical protein